MYNKEVFKNYIEHIYRDMSASCRGELTEIIEKQTLKELSDIYLTMAERYDIAAKEGSSFAAQPGVGNHPQEHRSYYALLDLMERMELDFTQKFALNVKHDLEKEIEIGKIQISFLDRVRRHLHGVRVSE